MNHRYAAVALFAMLAGLPFAVAQVPAPDASGPAAATAARGDETKPTMQPSRAGATDADARLCLEFPTHEQVIMCAEKYRPHKRRA
jgi:hypothetical protein